MTGPGRTIAGPVSTGPVSTGSVVAVGPSAVSPAGPVSTGPVSTGPVSTGPGSTAIDRFGGRSGAVGGVTAASGKHQHKGDRDKCCSAHRYSLFGVIAAETNDRPEKVPGLGLRPSRLRILDPGSWT